MIPFSWYLIVIAALCIGLYPFKVTPVLLAALVVAIFAA